MKTHVFLAAIFGFALPLATAASAQSNFASSKLSSGVVMQGAGFQSSKISPGVVVEGNAFQSSKLSAGMIVENDTFQSSKLSVGIVVAIRPGGGDVPRVPLVHW